MLNLVSGRGARLLSLIVSAALALTSVPPPGAWAAPAPSLPQPTLTDLSHLDLQALAVPETLGRIVERWRPRFTAPRGLVVHLQDIHAHPATQQRISDLIGYLQTRWGISVIGLEGTTGWCDTSVYADLPDPPTVRRIADVFLQEGLFTGPEHFAITHPGVVTLWGVDDEPLYLRHLRAFHESAATAAADRVTLERLREAVAGQESSAAYPRRAQRLIALRRARAEGIPVKGADSYLSELFRMAEAAGISLKPYPRLRALSVAQHRFERLRAGRVRAEQRRLIERLLARTQAPLRRQVMALEAAKAGGSLSEQQYLERLLSLERRAAHPSGRAAPDRAKRRAGFPALEAYLAYLRVASRVKPTDAAVQLAAFSDAVELASLQAGRQRTLAHVLRDLELLNGLIRVRLSPPERALYAQRRPMLAPDAFWRRLAEVLGPDVPVSQAALAALFEHLPSHERFYDEATARDQALVHNTVETLRAQGSMAGILVSGGYHTSGIARLLQERGVAYLVIAPQVSEAPDDVRYRAQLEQRVPSITQLFEGLDRHALAGTPVTGAIAQAMTERIQVPPAVAPDRRERSAELPLDEATLVNAIAMDARELLRRLRLDPADVQRRFDVWRGKHPDAARRLGVLVAGTAAGLLLTAAGLSLEFDTAGVLTAMGVQGGAPPEAQGTDAARRLDLASRLQALREAAPKTSAFLQSLGEPVEAWQAGDVTKVDVIRLRTPEGTRLVALRMRGIPDPVAFDQEQTPWPQQAMHALTPDHAPQLLFRERLEPPDAPSQSGYGNRQMTLSEFALGEVANGYLDRLAAAGPMDPEVADGLDTAFRALGRAAATWHDHGYSHGNLSLANVALVPGEWQRPQAFDFATASANAPNGWKWDLERALRSMERPTYQAAWGVRTIKRWKDALLDGYRSVRLAPDVESWLFDREVIRVGSDEARRSMAAATRPEVFAQGERVEQLQRLAASPGSSGSEAPTGAVQAFLPFAWPLAGSDPALLLGELTSVVPALIVLAIGLAPKLIVPHGDKSRFQDMMPGLTALSLLVAGGVGMGWLSPLVGMMAALAGTGLLWLREVLRASPAPAQELPARAVQPVVQALRLVAGRAGALQGADQETERLRREERNELRRRKEALQLAIRSDGPSLESLAAQPPELHVGYGADGRQYDLAAARVARWIFPEGDDARRARLTGLIRHYLLAAHIVDDRMTLYQPPKHATNRILQEEVFALEGHVERLRQEQIEGLLRRRFGAALIELINRAVWAIDDARMERLRGQQGEAGLTPIGIDDGETPVILPELPLLEGDRILSRLQQQEAPVIRRVRVWLAQTGIRRVLEDVPSSAASSAASSVVHGLLPGAAGLGGAGFESVLLTLAIGLPLLIVLNWSAVLAGWQRLVRERRMLGRQLANRQLLGSIALTLVLLAVPPANVAAELLRAPQLGAEASTQVVMPGWLHVERGVGQQIMDLLMDQANQRAGSQSEARAQARRTVEEILASHQDILANDRRILSEIDRLRRAGARIVLAIENSEAVRPEVERAGLREVRSSLKAWGVRQAVRRADDLYLIWNGPEKYLTAISADVPTVPIDQRALREEADGLIREIQRRMERLRMLTAEGGITSEQADHVNALIMQSAEEERKPRRAEIQAAIEAVGHPEARAAGWESLALLNRFLRNMERRNQVMAWRIRKIAQENPGATIMPLIGASHAPSVGGLLVRAGLTHVRVEVGRGQWVSPQPNWSLIRTRPPGPAFPGRHGGHGSHGAVPPRYAHVLIPGLAGTAAPGAEAVLLLLVIGLPLLIALNWSVVLAHWHRLSAATRALRTRLLGGRVSPGQGPPDSLEQTAVPYGIPVELGNSLEATVMLYPDAKGTDIRGTGREHSSSPAVKAVPGAKGTGSDSGAAPEGRPARGGSLGAQGSGEGQPVSTEPGIEAGAEGPDSAHTVASGVHGAEEPTTTTESAGLPAIRSAATPVVVPGRLCERPPARANHDDVFGIERQRYLDHALTGELPEDLESLGYSLPWPLDMTEPHAHISNFYGVPHFQNAPFDDSDMHEGIDIQTRPGTAVRCIEDGVVAFAERFSSERYPDAARQFTDVFIYSPRSRLVYAYVHLDATSVPQHIRDRVLFNRYSTVQVKAGEVIGKVAKWHTESALAEHVDVPAAVEDFYGRTHDHLHLEIRHVGSEREHLWDMFHLSNVPSVNPLLLLKPLYDPFGPLGNTGGKSGQSRSSGGSRFQAKGSGFGALARSPEPSARSQGRLEGAGSSGQGLPAALGNGAPSLTPLPASTFTPIESRPIRGPTVAYALWLALELRGLEAGDAMLLVLAISLPLLMIFSWPALLARWRELSDAARTLREWLLSGQGSSGQGRPERRLARALAALGVILVTLAVPPFARQAQHMALLSPPAASAGDAVGLSHADAATARAAAPTTPDIARNELERYVRLHGEEPLEFLARQFAGGARIVLLGETHRVEREQTFVASTIPYLRRTIGLTHLAIEAPPEDRHRLMWVLRAWRKSGIRDINTFLTRHASIIRQVERSLPPAVREERATLLTPDMLYQFGESARLGVSLGLGIMPTPAYWDILRNAFDQGVVIVPIDSGRMPDRDRFARESGMARSLERLMTKNPSGRVIVVIGEIHATHSTDVETQGLKTGREWRSLGRLLRDRYGAERVKAIRLLPFDEVIGRRSYSDLLLDMLARASLQSKAFAIDDLARTPLAKQPVRGGESTFDQRYDGLIYLPATRLESWRYRLQQYLSSQEPAHPHGSVRAAHVLLPGLAMLDGMAAWPTLAMIAVGALVLAMVLNWRSIPARWRQLTDAVRALRDRHFSERVSPENLGVENLGIRPQAQNSADIRAQGLTPNMLNHRQIIEVTDRGIQNPLGTALRAFINAHIPTTGAGVPRRKTLKRSDLTSIVSRVNEQILYVQIPHIVIGLSLIMMDLSYVAPAAALLTVSITSIAFWWTRLRLYRHLPTWAKRLLIFAFQSLRRTNILFGSSALLIIGLNIAGVSLPEAMDVRAFALAASPESIGWWILWGVSIVEMVYHFVYQPAFMTWSGKRLGGPRGGFMGRHLRGLSDALDRTDLRSRRRAQSAEGNHETLGSLATFFALGSSALFSVGTVGDARASELSSSTGIHGMSVRFIEHGLQGTFGVAIIGALLGLGLLRIYRSQSSHEATSLEKTLRRHTSLLLTVGFVGVGAVRLIGLLTGVLDQYFFERGTLLGTIDRYWLSDFLSVPALAVFVVHTFVLLDSLFREGQRGYYDASLMKRAVGWMGVNVSAMFVIIESLEMVLEPVTGIGHHLLDMLVFSLGGVFTWFVARLLYYPGDMDIEVKDTPPSAGDIVGPEVSPEEEARWRQEIEANSDKVREANPEVVARIQQRAGGLLERYEGAIRQALTELGRNDPDKDVRWQAAEAVRAIKASIQRMLHHAPQPSITLHDIADALRLMAAPLFLGVWVAVAGLLVLGLSYWPELIAGLATALIVALGVNWWRLPVLRDRPRWAARLALLAATSILAATLLAYGWQALDHKVRYSRYQPAQPFSEVEYGRDPQFQARLPGQEHVTAERMSRDAEMLQNLAREPVHAIPIEDIEFIRAIRKTPREVITYVRDSATAPPHHLPPHLLLTAVAVARPESTDSGPLWFGLDVLVRRKKRSETTRRTSEFILPESVLNANVVDSEWGDFLGGVVLGAKNTMGMAQIRPIWVRRYHAWQRFGIDATTLSDRTISWMLLDPRLNVEAMAAIWRGTIEDVKGFINDVAAGRVPDYRRFVGERLSAVKLQRLAEQDQERYRALAQSLPEEVLKGENDWELAQHHPMYGIRMWFLSEGWLQQNVILSGVLDDKPAELIVRTEHPDLARITRVGLKVRLEDDAAPEIPQSVDVTIERGGTDAQQGIPLPHMQGAITGVRSGVGAKTFTVSYDLQERGEDGAVWFTLAPPVDLTRDWLAAQLHFAESIRKRHVSVQVMVADAAVRSRNVATIPTVPLTKEVSVTLDADRVDALLLHKAQENRQKMAGLLLDQDPYIRAAAQGAVENRGVRPQAQNSADIRAQGLTPNMRASSRPGGTPGAGAKDGSGNDPAATTAQTMRQWRAQVLAFEAELEAETGEKMPLWLFQALTSKTFIQTHVAPVYERSMMFDVPTFLRGHLRDLHYPRGVPPHEGEVGQDQAQTFFKRVLGWVVRGLVVLSVLSFVPSGIAGNAFALHWVSGADMAMAVAIATLLAVPSSIAGRRVELARQGRGLRPHWVVAALAWYLMWPTLPWHASMNLVVASFFMKFLPFVAHLFRRNPLITGVIDKAQFDDLPNGQAIWRALSEAQAIYPIYDVAEDTALLLGKQEGFAAAIARAGFVGEEAEAIQSKLEAGLLTSKGRMSTARFLRHVLRRSRTQPQQEVPGVSGTGTSSGGASASGAGGAGQGEAVEQGAGAVIGASDTLIEQVTSLEEFPALVEEFRARVLTDEWMEYLAAIAARHGNPQNEAPTLVNPAAGGDISTALLLGNPSHVVMLDGRSYRNRALPVPIAPQLERYISNKALRRGRWSADSSEILGENLLPAMLLELTALGARDIAVQATPHPEETRITFQWAHPNEPGIWKLRRIRAIGGVTLEEPGTYAGLLPEPYDVYVEKAWSTMGESGLKARTNLTSRVRPGGRIITHIPEGDSLGEEFRHQFLSAWERQGFTAIETDPLVKSQEDGYGMRFGYGRVLVLERNNPSGPAPAGVATDTREQGTTTTRQSLEAPSLPLAAVKTGLSGEQRQAVQVIIARLRRAIRALETELAQNPESASSVETVEQLLRLAEHDLEDGIQEIIGIALSSSEPLDWERARHLRSTADREVVRELRAAIQAMREPREPGAKDADHGRILFEALAVCDRFLNLLASIESGWGPNEIAQAISGTVAEPKASASSLEPSASIPASGAPGASRRGTITPVEGGKAKVEGGGLETIKTK